MIPDRLKTHRCANIQFKKQIGNTLHWPYFSVTTGVLQQNKQTWY